MLPDNPHQYSFGRGLEPKKPACLPYPLMSGSSSHPGDVSEPTSGPPITQESVNLAETICSTSDNVLYVTYPQCGVLRRSRLEPQEEGALGGDGE